ncbi:MAG: efflux RND transporter periplasmic adaptor subunit [Stellaceae bacterium]
MPQTSAADAKPPAILRRAGRPASTARRAAWLLAAATAIVLLGTATAYWLGHRQAAVTYATAPVTRGVVARAVTATGTVNPVLTIIVGSYVSGVIQDQFCDFNTRVRMGQLCAKIDPRPYQTIVNQDKADLANAKAQLVKDQANLTYAKIAYERDAGLLKRGIVSQDAVDSAKSVYDQAQAQIEVDKAAIQQKEAALDSAQVNLGYTNIISPVDGTVVSRNITIGQTVAASFQTPTLFLIATDLTQMEVDTNVSESDVGDLREGDKAAFTVEAYGNRSFDGKVVQFRQAPQTVQNVVTYDVVIGVANNDLLLKPGMTATARIVIDQRDNVLRVPDQALRFSPSGPPSESSSAPSPSATTAREAQVWVLRDGHAMRRSLKTGLDDDSYSEVIDGDIQAGDQVIVGEQRAGGGGAASGSQPRLFGF